MGKIMASCPKIPPLGGFLSFRRGIALYCQQNHTQKYNIPGAAKGFGPKTSRYNTIL